MKRAKLLKTEPIEYPKIINKRKAIALSRITEADGEQALEIDLFFAGERRARYFADPDNHYAWINGKWTDDRLDNAALICLAGKARTGGWYYYGERNYVWASAEDEERTENYLGGCIEYYEDNLSQSKRQQAQNRKTERINDIMSHVPVAPDEMERWIEEEIFPENYLFFRKTPKGCAYSCTACQSKGWQKKRLKSGAHIICPKCGAEVITQKSKEQTISRKETIVLLQKLSLPKPIKIGRIQIMASEKHWIERQFHAVCSWEQEKKEICLYEDIRVLIPENKTYGKVYYGTIPNADEFGQTFWDSNPCNKRFASAYLYPGTLPDALPDCLKKSGIMEMMPQKFQVNKYIVNYESQPWLEYLAKAGLTVLTSEILTEYGWFYASNEPYEIEENAASLKEALKLDGNRTHRMKQINGTLNALRWLQYEQRQEDKGKHLRISQESLEFLNRKKLSPRDCEQLLKELGSVDRMVNYLKKQKVAPTNFIYTWRDYLRMAQNEGYDITDDIVRYPKDLKARHDQLVEQINQREQEKIARGKENRYRELDIKIQAHLLEAKKYFYEDDTYMIIPAGKCMELVEEGRALHHCVGSNDFYMSKMARGESWILFLRKKEDLEKPWYTIEIRMEDDKILQYYSEFDRKPELDKVDTLLKKFKQSIPKARKVQIRIA